MAGTVSGAGAAAAAFFLLVAAKEVAISKKMIAEFFIQRTGNGYCKQVLRLASQNREKQRGFEVARYFQVP